MRSSLLGARRSLTLGGGFGWRTSDLGMVCDNVLEFRAILADGSSVLVNAASEPDLFFALRGASLLARFLTVRSG